MNDRETFFLHGRWVVPVITQIERFEPLVNLVDILVAPFDRENALDDGVSIPVEIVSEVTVVRLGIETVQNRRASDGRSGLVGFALVDHCALLDVRLYV